MPDSMPTDERKLTLLKYFDETRKRPAADWVQALREAGAARFRETPFPHRKLEAWRFTNVAPILAPDYARARRPEPGRVAKADIEPVLFADNTAIELVFLNGHFAPELSRIPDLPKGVRVESLAASLAANGALIRPHLDRHAPAKGNIFSALNTAMIEDGAFIHAPRNCALDAAVHLVYIATPQAGPFVTYPRSLIVAGESSALTVIETYAALPDAGVYFTDAVTEYALEPNAQVTRYHVLQEGARAYHMAVAKIHQDRDSSFTSYSFTLGGKIARNELSSTLDGEGARCSLNGLYTTAGEQLVDNLIGVEHAKPHCTSWIGYKGILDDASRAVFSGQVMVRREAQKTDSNQLNNNLLLSDKATIDTKPLLEIFADDVKCTHGATVGQHPREVVYYFQTRGMTEAMARAMLTYGFADEVVNQVAYEPLRAQLEKVVFEQYSPI